MKKIWKNNSKTLIIISILEIILSIYFLTYFGYMDRLNYVESINASTSNLALLIENMYTSTWWALIISFVSIISIFTLTSILFKKSYLHFISICLWILLFILALDFTKSLTYNLTNAAIFVPIIGINILAYIKEKKY